jgi:hypothetical protein
MPIAVLLIAAIVIVAVLILVAWSASRRQRQEGLQRSNRLREQFGAEYDRMVAELGDTRRAETELTARQERVSTFDIRHLAADETERFDDEWRVVQSGFIDDPLASVRDAEALVGRVMEARGYPAGDFEQHSADISVDHSRVLKRYRAAHEIALRHALGRANTEDLRQAVIGSHALFSELVEEPSMIDARPDSTVLVPAQ